MNNRILLVVFVACLALFFGARFLRKDRTSSFDPVISAIDTSLVDRIHIVGGSNNAEEYELIRTDKGWNAVKGNRTINLQASRVTPVLSPLADLQAKRVITKSKEKYEEFEITDEKVSRVTAWQGKKKLAELLVGGFKFDPQTKTAFGYLRLPGKDEVYLIDGFMTISMKPGFNQFRDRKLVNVLAEDLTSLEWQDNAGRKEVIQKESGAWHYAGMEAVDSTSFATYVSALVNAQGSEFSDITSANGMMLKEKLTLYGNNMLEPTILSAYMSNDGAKPFILHSTINPDAFFLSDTAGLYQQIFSDLYQFWPNGQ